MYIRQNCANYIMQNLRLLYRPVSRPKQHLSMKMLGCLREKTLLPCIHHSIYVASYSSRIGVQRNIPIEYPLAVYTNPAWKCASVTSLSNSDPSTFPLKANLPRATAVFYKRETKLILSHPSASSSLAVLFRYHGQAALLSAPPAPVLLIRDAHARLQSKYSLTPPYSCCAKDCQRTHWPERDYPDSPPLPSVLQTGCAHGTLLSSRSGPPPLSLHRQFRRWTPWTSYRAVRGGSGEDTRTAGRR